jgi:hypothetical protein
MISGSEKDIYGDLSLSHKKSFSILSEDSQNRTFLRLPIEGSVMNDFGECRTCIGKYFWERERHEDCR